MDFSDSETKNDESVTENVQIVNGVFLVNDYKKVDSVNDIPSENGSDLSSCIIPNLDEEESKIKDKFCSLNPNGDEGSQYILIEGNKSKSALNNETEGVGDTRALRKLRHFSDGISYSLTTRERVQLPENINGILSESNIPSVIGNTENISNTVLRSVSFIQPNLKREMLELKSVKFCEKVNECSTDEQSSCQNNYREYSSSQDRRKINEISDKFLAEENLEGSNTYVKGCYSTDDIESKNSSKWNNTGCDGTYSSSYFFNSEDPASNQFSKVCTNELVPNIEDFTDITESHKNSESISESQIDSENLLLNDSTTAPDSDSSQSLGASSNTYESAMSSSDMMTPFGSPRALSNSKSSHNTPIKKIGINFANLTSENIPGTIKRISAHKAIEDIFLNNSDMKGNLSKQKSDKERLQQFSGNHKDYKRAHSSNSSNNSHSNQQINKSTERKLDKLDKLFLAKRNSLSSGQHSYKKDASLKGSLKTSDHIQIQKHKKELNKMNATNKSDEQEKNEIPFDCNEVTVVNCETHHNSICDTPVLTLISEDASAKLKTEIDDHSQLTNIVPHVEQNKKKFTSKIPRPINVTGQNLSQKSKNLLKESKGRFEKVNEYVNGEFNLANEKSYRSCFNDSEEVISFTRKNSIFKRQVTGCQNIKSNINYSNTESDRSESISRPSEDSECSYKNITSLSKTKEDARQYPSKLTTNNPRISNLRSKYWSKEDKHTVVMSKSLNSSLKKAEPKTKMQSNDSPQYGTTYGKIVRVKTAPIKIASALDEKSTVKEFAECKPRRSAPRINYYKHSAIRNSDEDNSKVEG